MIDTQIVHVKFNIILSSVILLLIFITNRDWVSW